MRLFFVSTLTYSLSSLAPSICSDSFLTAMYASPRICNAAARSCALARGIEGSSSTLSQVSRRTDSISSLAPLLTNYELTRFGQGKTVRTLNKACTPFSAAWSSRRFFSSGERLPAASAACICSKTCLSSIAERRVEKLKIDEIPRRTGMSTSDLRFAEDVVFTLHIVQPTAHSEKRLVRREEMLRFRSIYETDRL